MPSGVNTAAMPRAVATVPAKVWTVSQNDNGRVDLRISVGLLRWLLCNLARYDGHVGGALQEPIRLSITATSRVHLTVVIGLVARRLAAQNPRHLEVEDQRS